MITSIPNVIIDGVPAGGEDDFVTLREILQCGDSPLSKAITHLQAAGYVVARKGNLGSRPRTWVRSTAAGREAFAGHLQALREIVALGGRAALGDRPLHAILQV